MKKNDKKTEIVIFTFCYNPSEQTMTFAGNISIIEAARLLQNKVFDSITLGKPEEQLTKEEVKDVN